MMYRDTLNYNASQFQIDIKYVGCHDVNNPTCLNQMEKVQGLTFSL